jgi:integrase
MLSEVSPKRPRITDAGYQLLSRASAELGRNVQVFLYLAHETGHRSHAIRHLRWADIAFDGRSITWRAGADKMGNEHQTPLLAKHVEMLRAYQQESSSIGEAWVFPSPDDPSQPVSRRETIRWWERLEQLAGLSHLRGRGWHSLRRKFCGRFRQTSSGAPNGSGRLEVSKYGGGGLPKAKAGQAASSVGWTL